MLLILLSLSLLLILILILILILLAFIEQKCAECSSVDELLDQLEGKHIDNTNTNTNTNNIDKFFALSGTFALERQLSYRSSSGGGGDSGMIRSSTL